jgi:hypothetical protein
MTDDDGRSRQNGSAWPDDTLDEDEDAPLDEVEAATGTAAAAERLDESLGERVEAVVADLGGVDRRPGSEGVAFAVNGREFAFLGEDHLEAGLDQAVAKAALRTPDTAASARGGGWIVFRPSAPDRFALDRAEAWVRSAYKRATG